MYRAPAGHTPRRSRGTSGIGGSDRAPAERPGVEPNAGSSGGGVLAGASRFESRFIPFCIMFSVSLAVTGGVLAVRWAHAVEPAIKMDTVTMLGS